jgi:8-oxo-dGTP pyrophosphatase MutT (NUDIX family)
MNPMAVAPAQIAQERERLLARARLEPGERDAALVLAGHVCGHLPAELAQSLAQDLSGLQWLPAPNGAGADPAQRSRLLVQGADSALRSHVLEGMARHLLATGAVSAWRDELLDVRPAPESVPLASVDRSAVRVLGITTASVHLNAYDSDGLLVVALRASHKRVDPGLWDNLAGGMIASGEDPMLALAREAHEEAGLEPGTGTVRPVGSFYVRRPIAEGVLSERVHVFDVRLPAGWQPRNLDGEVERFARCTPQAALVDIAAGHYSVEAALATLLSLEQRPAQAGA